MARVQKCDGGDEKQRFWNSEADQPDEADEADEAETVAATAARTPPPHAPGVRMTVVYNKLPQIKRRVIMSLRKQGMTSSHTCTFTIIIYKMYLIYTIYEI